jgi:hypothetical protein
MIAFGLPSVAGAALPSIAAPLAHYLRPGTVPSTVIEIRAQHFGGRSTSASTWLEVRW